MALSATEAPGKQCERVFFLDHAQVRGALLTLNGLGLRTASVFKVGVYVAALYLTEPSSDPHRILQSNTPSELVRQGVCGNDCSVAADASPGRSTTGGAAGTVE